MPSIDLAALSNFSSYLPNLPQSILMRSPSISHFAAAWNLGQKKCPPGRKQTSNDPPDHV